MLRPAIAKLMISFLLLPGNHAAAQEKKMSDEYKSSAIERINKLIVASYVFPEVAKETGKHLLKKHQDGHFEKDSTLILFAQSLTEELQSVKKDKHMRVRPNSAAPNSGMPGNTGDGGFKEVKMLEGNIGYIDMRLFFPVSVAGPIADEHMRKLSAADAIIIDLRKNGGGNPGMVQYLCSYFFDEKIHLNSLYFRETNTTTEFWTVDVKGKTRPDIPLFILTSKWTFSGAEEFSYNMQTQKRATLIGETTGGGANPGGSFRINDELNIFIPTGKAINPVTGTNWEGVGVIPEIAVTAEQALEKAIKVAMETIKKKKPA